MRRRGKTKADAVYLKALGENLEKLIKKKGFTSVYDFWIKKVGDEMSRSALNYIVVGKTDPKASTLRALAKRLKIHPKEILDFD